MMNGNGVALSNWNPCGRERVKTDLVHLVLFHSKGRGAAEIISEWLVAGLEVGGGGGDPDRLVRRCLCLVCSTAFV